MPFRDEFDDVYAVIKKSAAETARHLAVTVNCFRADEIARPGRITDQILQAIQQADVIIADLTGSNLTSTRAPSSEFESVVNKWRFAAPEHEKADADRALADYMASSSERSHQDRAIGIYERLLSQELDSDDRHAVLHNVATLYFHNDRADLARAFWTEAYKLQPGHPAVRAAFSQLLARQGAIDAALRVASGEPIE
jgi:tetratricopeptide (TPR) repeat protein